MGPELNPVNPPNPSNNQSIPQRAFSRTQDGLRVAGAFNNDVYGAARNEASDFSATFAPDGVYNTLAERKEELEKILNSAEFNAELTKALTEFKGKARKVFEDRSTHMNMALTALGGVIDDKTGSITPKNVKVGNVIASINALKEKYNKDKGTTYSIIQVLKSTETKVIELDPIKSSEVPDSDAVAKERKNATRTETFQPYIQFYNLIQAIVGDDISTMDDKKLIDALEDKIPKISKTKDDVNEAIFKSFRANNLGFKEILKKSVQEGKTNLDGLFGKKPISSLSSIKFVMQNNSKGADGKSTSKYPDWLSIAINTLAEGENPYTPFSANQNSPGKEEVGRAKKKVEDFVDKIDSNNSKGNMLRLRESLVQELKNKVDSSSNDYEGILTLAWKIQILSKGENAVDNIVELSKGNKTEAELGISGSNASTVLKDKTSEYGTVRKVLEQIDNAENTFVEDLTKAAPQSYLSTINGLYGRFFAGRNTSSPVGAIVDHSVKTSESFIFEVAVRNKIQETAQTISKTAATGKVDSSGNTVDNDTSYLLAASNKLLGDLVEKNLGLLGKLKEQGLQILGQGAEAISKAGQTAFGR